MDLPGRTSLSALTMQASLHAEGWVNPDGALTPENIRQILHEPKQVRCGRPVLCYPSSAGNLAGQVRPPYLPLVCRLGSDGHRFLSDERLDIVARDWREFMAGTKALPLPYGHMQAAWDEWCQMERQRYLDLNVPYPTPAPAHHGLDFDLNALDDLPPEVMLYIQLHACGLAEFFPDLAAPQGDLFGPPIEESLEFLGLDANLDTNDVQWLVENDQPHGQLSVSPPVNVLNASNEDKQTNLDGQFLFVPQPATRLSDSVSMDVYGGGVFQPNVEWNSVNVLFEEEGDF